jgi:hypothetical protein
LRQHDLSFANFVLRFGPRAVLLDYAEEIVLPAFLNETHIRKRGETEFRFFNTTLRRLGEHQGEPILGIAGHFVKDTKLRRQQIFREGRGIVANEAEIESAPSAFFVLILNNHRLLYFAETAGAPTLDTFGATAELFLRTEWHRFIRERVAHDNVTRRGTERVTVRQMMQRIPTPVVEVIKVAGEDAITESISRFGKITQIKLKLIQPNDETDASEAVSAVEQSMRPLEPSRLELIASQPKGLNKAEVERAITEVAEGHNTHIVVDGEDVAGLKMQADNDEFALSVPIEEPPREDADLTTTLYDKYQELVAEGKVKSLDAVERITDRIRQLAQRL